MNKSGAGRNTRRQRRLSLTGMGALEKQWLTSTRLRQINTRPERYGFDAWLAGFEATKNGSRSNAGYVEKVILSELDKHPHGAGGDWSAINGSVPDYMRT